MKFTYFGGMCVLAERSDGKKLLFDPYISKNPQTSMPVEFFYDADYVFVTHAANDHYGDVEEIAALPGYDFVSIDCEHALMSHRKLWELLATARLAGIPCQVRIPDRAILTALLGQEPAGVMIPHVESPEEAYEAENMDLIIQIESRRALKENLLNKKG